MPHTAVPYENWILSTLPPAERDRLASHLTQVELTQGQVLHRAGEEVGDVYFPNSGLVSLAHTDGQDKTLQVAMIGCDGAVGTHITFADGALSRQTQVVMDGTAWRIRAALFWKEFKRGQTLSEVVFRHEQVLLAQAGQTALCSGLHSVEERLSSYILRARLWSQMEKLAITQPAIAGTLGIRRPSITTAEGTLQSLGLVDRHRGHLVVLDADALAARSCTCYRVLSRQLEHFARFLQCPHQCKGRPRPEYSDTADLAELVA